MKYRKSTEELTVYYSSMNGITGEPWRVIKSGAVSDEPLMKLHYHSVPEISICSAGSGEYYIADRIYPFKKGDIQIIHPFVPHYAKSNEGDTAELEIITFDAAKAMQAAGIMDPEKIMLMKNIDIPFTGVFGENEYPTLTACIKNIINCHENYNEYSDISAAFSIGEFLIACKKLGAAGAESFAPEIRKKEYFRIAPAINCINLNISDSAALGEGALASVCGMSVSNFRRIFKAETGIPPRAFIIKSRLSYAGYLLKNTDMTVAEIAERVGYNEISSFNKIFIKTYSVSPARYRKLYK